MTKQYDLVFDLITEMNGNYGSDNVERLTARETKNFYFTQNPNGTETRYPKLTKTTFDDCVSERSSNHLSTSETRLHIADCPKAVKIRHNRKMLKAVEKITAQLKVMLQANDSRILEIAEKLEIKI